MLFLQFFTTFFPPSNDEDLNDVTIIMTMTVLMNYDDGAKSKVTRMLLAGSKMCNYLIILRLKKIEIFAL